MADTPKSEVQTLVERLKDGPMTIWATLREDTYETFLGDGYYAYVDRVFLTPTEAARAVEEAMPEEMIRLHIRRYDLKRSGDKIIMFPSPTEQEPTTVDVIAEKIGPLQSDGGAALCQSS